MFLSVDASAQRAQLARARSTGARPAPVRRVGYALPRHLQQYAAPANYDEPDDIREEAEIAEVGCTDDFGNISAGIMAGDCFGNSCTSGGDCGGSCGGLCGGAFSSGGHGGCSTWSAGLEFTLIQPHFEENTAFTTSDTDDAELETITDSNFDYDTEFAPRVWLELLGGGDCGLRLTYWQFDYASGDVQGSPPANGLGLIRHPAFGDVDLSTTTLDRFFLLAAI